MCSIRERERVCVGGCVCSSRKERYIMVVEMAFRVVASLFLLVLVCNVAHHLG